MSGAGRKNWPRSGDGRFSDGSLAPAENAFLRALAGELGVTLADLTAADLMEGAREPGEVGLPAPRFAAPAPSADLEFRSRLMPPGWAHQSADFAPGYFFSLRG